MKKILTNKLNDWLSTIKDKDLREKVREEVLVSGGSIASMFLKEDINDFDLYIKSQDTLFALASYYFKGKVLDGRKRQEYIDSISNGQTEQEMEENISEIMVRYRTLKEDQIKLDIASEGMRFDKKLLDPKGIEIPYQLAFLSQNAISLTGDIQIVLRFNGDSTTIHKTFDFMHATNYFTFEEGLVTNITALESIITKDLKYQGSLYPLTSIIRMKKFLKRGWNIGAGEILKIMFQISELDLRNPDVLEEQLIGVDVAYFGALIKLIRDGVDEKEFTSQYLNSLIDKVFNEYEDDQDNVKPESE